MRRWWVIFLLKFCQIRIGIRVFRKFRTKMTNNSQYTGKLWFPKQKTVIIGTEKFE